MSNTAVSRCWKVITVPAAAMALYVWEMTQVCVSTRPLMQMESFQCCLLAVVKCLLDTVFGRSAGCNSS